MPTPSSAAAAWLGAPPVCAGAFAFANGDFFVETSGHHRHRRATPAELSTHVAAGSDRDHPAHWFEAQLLHYGLPPSKTKAVARMRLYDAVKAGNLAVPAHMARLEAELKKDWTKKDREAKKASLGAVAAETKKAATKAKTTAKTTIKTTVKTTAGIKRKAEVNVAVTVNATLAASDVSKPSASKKAKTATPQKKKPASKAGPGATAASTAPAKKSPAKKPPETKPPAKKPMARRRGGVSQPSGRATPTNPPSPTPTPAPRTKQTARRSGAFVARGRIPFPPPQGSGDQGEPTRASRPKQTARRSGAFMARGRIPAPGSQDNRDDDYPDFDPDDPPPPYSPYHDDNDNDSQEDYYDDDDFSQDNADTFGQEISLAPLGLLNGSYDVSCPTVTSEWPFYGSDFDLVLTLAGSSLWGSFDLGVIRGVLHFDERPWQSSYDCVPFRWRGREKEGPIYYGDEHQGWIKFLGDGRVEGWLDYQSITFRGHRLPGQGTRSQADVRSLQTEWDDYSEDCYERERVSRWH